MISLKDESQLRKFRLENASGIKIELLANGSIFSIQHQDNLINQVLGTPLEGSLNNIYLRVWEKQKIAFYPLIGPQSDSRFYWSEQQAVWQGICRGIKYQCRLRLLAKAAVWVWEVQLENSDRQSRKIDLVFTQDLGLANRGAVRNNEAYACQYIDHKVLKHPRFGYLICSRQNQAQGKAFPWIMHGCLEKTVGYLTDGFQFYGLQYKASNIPQALVAATLPNEVYQYEFAAPTLQIAPRVLASGKSRQVTFFASYSADHPGVTEQADIAAADNAVILAEKELAKPDALDPEHEITRTATLFDQVRLFPTKELNDHELKLFFPGKARNVEKKRGKLLSFFYGDHVYVVLPAKELQVERPHGQILRSGQAVVPDEEMLATTGFIYGIFHSQLTIGNTSFNKMLSVSRNHLNVIKSSGQRIFVKTKQGMQLLGMPSAMEIGLNHCRWIYKGKEATISVRTWASMEQPECFLELEVLSGSPQQFVITNQVVLGNNEWDNAGRIELEAGQGEIRMLPGKKELISAKYPEASFSIKALDAKQIQQIGNDGLLFVDQQDRQYPYVTLLTKAVKKIQLMLTGGILDQRKTAIRLASYTGKGSVLKQVGIQTINFWNRLLKTPRLQLAKKTQDLDGFNDLFYWYAHNAMIHYTSPHGLEQYSGAAWGLRDVCQGPIEFMLCTRNFPIMREILKTMFAHQLFESGDWPQWFMFDRYYEIQAPDSHGDIIVWPIKAVCDYIEATSDYSILDEVIDYTSEKTKMAVKQPEPLLAHIRRQLEKIKRECAPGTALISYGHGDWEDTLQPADPTMRTQMVSAWTVELTYQTLNRFKKVCSEKGYRDLAQELEVFCQQIQADFNRYLIKAGVVAGLAYFHKNGAVEYLLHPSDKRTGIQYRLLPMTRGMISEMFTPEQMQRHLSIIQKHLLFPDGVRFMEKPIPYQGGIEKNFKRAETAANFGREIGMQYVHAHIRYLEAMAKIGQADALYQGFLMINPILTPRTVPNSMPRQSNAYFSSSDADFKDRYQAFREFGRIKKGLVPTKGGWRIYSSGPGIFLNQFISGLLGLREAYSDVVFDPVMAKALDGLRFEFEYAGKRVEYVYRVKQKNYSPSALKINGKAIAGTRWQENPYRPGGLLIEREEYLRCLNKVKNVVEIIL